MRKVLLALLSLFICITLPTSYAYAESANKGSACEPVISDDVDKTLTEYKEEHANMAEKFVTSQVENLVHIGDINSLSNLVFGNPYCVWAEGESNQMADDGIFTVEQREEILNPMLKLLGSSSALVLLLSMLITGIKTMTNSMRGQAMDEFWNDARMWFWAMFLFYFYTDLTNILFELNRGFVQSIRELLANDISSKTISAMSSVEDFFPALLGSFLIVVLAEWILALIMNVVYVARLVVILVLLVMGFIAIYSLLFSKTRAFFGTWLRELCGNIFLNSIHAIVFFIMIKFAGLGAGVFFKLALMMMFIPVSGMISKWLNIGDSSSKVGSALTMVGLGGISSTMMLASQAGSILRGGSVFNSGGMLSNSSSNSFNGGSLTDLTNSMANDSLRTSISSSALGTNSTLFNGAKSMASNFGGFVGGISGAVAGPGGVAVGTKLGSAFGSGFVQTSNNLISGISSSVSTLREGNQFSNENGQGFKALFSKDADFGTLNTRRQVMGSLGESMGLVVGGQTGASVGRKLGFALSGVSKESLSDSMSSQFNIQDAVGKPAPLTMSSLAQKFPNSDAKWVQTNQGSAFYVNGDSGWQQVGLTGAADSALSMGEARVMDYKMSDPNLQYDLQPNGTYKTPSSYSESDLSSNAFVNSPGKMETVGLQGSTPSIMRNSDAYIINTGDDSKIGNSPKIVETISSSNNIRYQDKGFDAKSVNPDAYVYNNVPGIKNRTTTDKTADTVRTLGSIANWSTKAKAQSSNERIKKVL